jgi:hypothetical protein
MARASSYSIESEISFDPKGEEKKMLEAKT